MDQKIKAIYKYILCGAEEDMVFALTNPEMVLFVDKYCFGKLRDDISDMVSKSNILLRHYRDTVYLEKLKNKKYKKGCFKRV